MSRALDSAARTSSGRLDATLTAFNRKLDGLTEGLRKKLLSYLAELDFDEDSVVANTQKNLKRLNKAGEYARRQASSLGYDDLVESLLSDYDIQPGLVRQAFEETLGLKFDFSKSDQKELRVLLSRDRANLEGVIDSMASRVAERARFFAGVSEYRDMLDVVESAVGVTRANAATLAETGSNIFVRTIHRMGADEVGAERFYFAGPMDLLTRPFCRSLIERGREFSRTQIARMDNGQLPDVLTTGGGYNCRHIWVPVPKL